MRAHRSPNGSQPHASYIHCLYTNSHGSKNNTSCKIITADNSGTRAHLAPMCIRLLVSMPLTSRIQALTSPCIMRLFIRVLSPYVPLKTFIFFSRHLCIILTSNLQTHVSMCRIGAGGTQNPPPPPAPATSNSLMAGRQDIVAIQECGGVFVCICFGLCILGVFASKVEAHDDVQLEAWLYTLSTLGFTSGIVIMSLLCFCYLLNVCLLRQYGCGGGGCLFRLGLAGVIVVPVLWLTSVIMYGLFVRHIWHKSCDDDCWYISYASTAIHLICFCFALRVLALLYSSASANGPEVFDFPSTVTHDHYRGGSWTSTFKSEYTQPLISKPLPENAMVDAHNDSGSEETSPLVTLVT
ncbi:hypothetical protein AAMO2058_000228500 [Amorphochlora amoebiformis]